MDRAFQLLTDLSIDPFRLDDFLHDPLPELKRAGLDAQALPMLSRSDWLAPEAVWERCASCGDPGTDPLPDPDVPDSMPGMTVEV